MSFQKLRQIPVQPNIIRDFAQSWAESSDKTIDVLAEYQAMGLDIMLHNRGASSITISIDKRTVITVEAGDTLIWESVKFSLIEVTASVNYDLIVAGTYLTKAQVALLRGY